MRAIGAPLDALIRQGELILPLTHAEADYRRAMCHGDRIGVEVQVLELRQRSFSIGYRFLSEAGEVAATALTVHVLIAQSRSTTPELPADLHAALANHLATN